MSIASAAMACVLACAAGSLVPSSAPAGEPPAPATLVLTHRVDLGSLSPARWDNAMRWTQLAVTSEGHLLIFYSNSKREIVYRLSKDGRGFEEPVVAAAGGCPSVALDGKDNVFLVFKTGGARTALKVLPLKEPGQWDMSGQPIEVLAGHADGPQHFPSVLVLPGSNRIWVMTNYQPVDLASGPDADKFARSKPKSHAVLTFSDDGGKTWAEPEFVGSDSGDVGSGIVVLRPYCGRPAWFWTFWDCATPAWGFFDGSLYRGSREFFPHTRTRMAVGHPWDVCEDGQAGLYFATGLGSALQAQVYKHFDGSKWSDEVFLSGVTGSFVLLPDGPKAFAAATEGGRVSLCRLDGTQAVRLPPPYQAPEGRQVDDPCSLPAGWKPAGYFPLFLTELTARQEGGKTKLDEPRLVYLRLEPKPLEDSTGAATSGPASRPLLDPQSKNAGALKPMPVNDTRVEARTDVPKDRHWVCAGGRWVLIYADDNPGRLMAATVDGGQVGRRVTLVDRPGWGRFQCSAVADGDDALVAVCVGTDELTFVRMTGLKDWDKAQPKVVARSVRVRAEWPTICRKPMGDFVAAVVTSRGLALATSKDGELWILGDAFGSPTPDPRPAVVQAADKTLLLVGGREGLWCLPLDGTKPGEPQPVVKEKWIGHHFSAITEGDRMDLVYTPGESYLGARKIGHVRLEGGQWKPMPPVDVGRVIRGLSLCALGDGRLLCLYAVRSERGQKVKPGVEKMKRFTYVLESKVFDGKAWPAEGTKIVWPDVPAYRPEAWRGLTEVEGVIYIPEKDLGRFPTLPERAGESAKAVPAAWMVPGFHCLPKKERNPPDRGGLLITTEIPVP